jgi:hypothetical protein
VVVDWTRLVVTMDTMGRRQGTEGVKAVEELARRSVDAGVRQGAARIQVDRNETVDDLLIGALAAPIKARMGGWLVTEAVYYASGRVGLHAELPLQDLLKPKTVATAVKMPDGLRESPWTGLLIDARGTGVVPAWSPRLLDVAGSVLHDGLLWEEAAVNRVPIAYVDDPAHPAATAVGDNPLLLRAREARLCDLVLAPEDVARFRSDVRGTRLAGEGRLVIVIDP